MHLSVPCEGRIENMAQKPNSIVHVEFHSNAPEKTKSFLKDVFGWKFEDVPQMNYSMFNPPSAPGPDGNHAGPVRGTGAAAKSPGNTQEGGEADDGARQEERAAVSLRRNPSRPSSGVGARSFAFVRGRLSRHLHLGSADEGSQDSAFDRTSDFRSRSDPVAWLRRPQRFGKDQEHPEGVRGPREDLRRTVFQDREDLDPHFHRGRVRRDG